jgi:hypothetical protein
MASVTIRFVNYCGLQFTDSFAGWYYFTNLAAGCLQAR